MDLYSRRIHTIKYNYSTENISWKVWSTRLLRSMSYLAAIWVHRSIGLHMRMSICIRDFPIEPPLTCRTLYTLMLCRTEQFLTKVWSPACNKPPMHSSIGYRCARAISGIVPCWVVSYGDESNVSCQQRRRIVVVVVVEGLCSARRAGYDRPRSATSRCQSSRQRREHRQQLHDVDVDCSGHW